MVGVPHLSREWFPVRRGLAGGEAIRRMDPRRTLSYTDPRPSLSTTSKRTCLTHYACMHSRPSIRTDGTSHCTDRRYTSRKPPSAAVRQRPVGRCAKHDSDLWFIQLPASRPWPRRRAMTVSNTLTEHSKDDTWGGALCTLVFGSALCANARPGLATHARCDCLASLALCWYLISDQTREWPTVCSQ